MWNYFVETQNILSWKGPMRITKPNSWLHTVQPKSWTRYLRATHTPGAWGREPLPGELLPVCDHIKAFLLTSRVNLPQHSPGASPRVLPADRGEKRGAPLSAPHEGPAGSRGDSPQTPLLPAHKPTTRALRWSLRHLCCPPLQFHIVNIFDRRYFIEFEALKSFMAFKNKKTKNLQYPKSMKW